METSVNTADRQIDRISPHLIRRTGGGWLAIAPKNAKIANGVAASTEELAREKFSSVFHRWLEILASGEKGL
jgi:hypothetical protein